MNPISAISAAAAVAPVSMPAAVPAGDASFSSILSKAMDRVEAYRTNADTAVERFLSGEDEEVHKVAMATQQAELSLDLFLQAKNKVVQAYQEIMRMQL